MKYKGTMADTISSMVDLSTNIEDMITTVSDDAMVNISGNDILMNTGKYSPFNYAEWVYAKRKHRR